MAKKRVFVSFDFDNDKTLKDFIIGQAKLEDSPFEVVDHSLKEAAPQKNCLDKATTAIKRADVFIVTREAAWPESRPACWANVRRGGLK